MIFVNLSFMFQLLQNNVDVVINYSLVVITDTIINDK